MRYSRHRNDNVTIKTEQHPPPLYAASTAVFMMEIVKFISCNFVVLYEHRGNFINYWNNLQEELSFLEIVRVSIPSFLYTVQNNLLYYALTHLDAATYQVCYQVL